jgi:hypothetical protein
LGAALFTFKGATRALKHPTDSKDLAFSIQRRLFVFKMLLFFVQ